MVQYLNFKRIIHIAAVGAVASDLSGIVVIRIKLNPPLFVKIYWGGRMVMMMVVMLQLNP